MKKLLKVLILITVILSAIFSINAFAADSQNERSSVVAENIVLGVGADETERKLAYFSSISDAGSVKVAKASDVISSVFPSNYEEFFPSSTSASNAIEKYAKSVTITGLVENTRYAYVIEAGGSSSDIYYFETGSYGDYEFVFVGDPQINTQSHGSNWQDTLNKIVNNFNSQLLISAGDQVTTPDSEEQYSYLTQKELASIAFAPTVGPNHDSESTTFGDHFNLPNLSDKYGANETSANYWYTYNNTLFMHLNMSDTSAATNGEHESFMREAISENPDATWKIVVMHTSLFSTGMHGDPNYEYYSYEVGKYRPILTALFNELDIDIVLSGHDHVYLRTYMMNGTEQSSDEIIDNSVTSPEGVLYLCASSSTGSKFYDQCYEADFAAYDNYEKRKSAVRFEVTDTTITLKSYFLDDMSIFDTFTIYKEPHVCAPTLVKKVESTCTKEGKQAYYVCKCTRTYMDEEATIKISDIDSWGIIKTKEHVWKPATCTTPGMCANCRAINKYPTGHEYDDEYDPTCNLCNETRTVSEAPDKDNSDNSNDNIEQNEINPDNTQNNNATLVLIIGISAGAILLIGAVVTLLIFKKKNK